jgi:hypothetical protein
MAAVCVEALQAGHKILICGNGGSAADAQHFAAELVGPVSGGPTGARRHCTHNRHFRAHCDCQRLRIRCRVQSAGSGSRAGWRRPVGDLYVGQ